MGELGQAMAMPGQPFGGHIREQNSVADRSAHHLPGPRPIGAGTGTLRGHFTLNHSNFELKLNGGAPHEL